MEANLCLSVSFASFRSKLFGKLSQAISVILNAKAQNSGIIFVLVGALECHFLFLSWGSGNYHKKFFMAVSYF